MARGRKKKYDYAALRAKDDRKRARRVKKQVRGGVALLILLVGLGIVILVARTESKLEEPDMTTSVVERQGSWVYIQSEHNLWTVGFYTPQGDWITESDHDSEEAAAARVHYLNGGK